MLMNLNPGLKCKKCEKRMNLGRDGGNTNIVLTEDEEIPTSSTFDIIIRCEDCMMAHKGKAFIRDGEFKGVYEYWEVP